MNYGHYDDNEDLYESVGRHLKDGYELCTREEFTAFYMGESKLLSEITKEL